LEAAATGRPLVATDVPGCREIVRSGINGLLVPVRDHVSLAAGIKRLAEDSDLMLAMGHASRRIVEEEFALDRVVRETFQVYRTLALGSSIAHTSGTAFVHKK
jgi:glycosyltransferase involved in cell wall biosynthesis